ncbi:MAG: hypothetical protein IJC75_03345 [Oscillospiraceae bacterium]|nr:hypothetical protein [Oscillospiraceae bacterium]
MRSAFYRMLSVTLLCMGLCACGTQQSPELSADVSQQTDEPSAATTVTTTASTSAATMLSAEPDTLLYAESHTKALCDAIARRQFTVKMESYYQDTLLALVYLEVNGDDLHMRTEYMDTGQETELYCVENAMYILRKDSLQCVDASNRYAVENDPDSRQLCGLFFNCGTFAAPMTVLSEKTSETEITERFEHGGQEMYLVFDAESGALLRCGSKESEQRVSLLEETAVQITLPQQAAHN